MSVIFNPQTGKYESTLDISNNSSFGGSAIEQKRSNRLSQYGFDPAPAPKTSIFEKLLDLLPRTESASASLLGGLGLGRGLSQSLADAGDSLTGKRKYSYKDVLTDAGMGEGITKNLLGFGLGTALDPLTYLPVGKILGAAGKVAKPLVGLAKEAPLIGKFVTPAVEGLEAAGKWGKNALGFKTFASQGEKELDTLLKGVSGGTNFAANANFEKYKPIFEGLTKSTPESLQLLSKAIEKPKTYYKQLDEVGAHLYQGLDAMFKETGDVKKTAGIVKNLIGGTVKQNEAITTIAGAIKSGDTAGARNLYKTFSQETKLPKFKDIVAGDLKNKFGLGGPEADAYLPHMITDEFRQKILDMGQTPEEAINSLKGVGRRNIPKIEKERTLMGTIADLNRQAQKAYGVPIFENDLKKIVPKYLYNYSRNTALLDMNKEVLKLTDNIGSPLIKSIGEKEVPAGLVKLTGLPYQAGYAAKPEIAKQINSVMGVLSSDPALNKFIKGFDKVQNLWKTAVTVPNPSFHLNNLMGASFNNFIKDSRTMSPEIITDTIKTLKGKPFELVSDGGKKMASNEFLDYMKKHGALSSFISPEQMVSPTTGIKAAGAKIAEGVGGGVENLVRTQMALANWKKTGSLTDAVRAVWEVHGNYSPEAMSSFERNVVKRVMPFYTWSKTNIPFQINNLLNKTGKYAAAARLQNMAVSPEDRAKLPEWLRSSALLPSKQNSDGTQTVRSFGTPVKDLNDFGSLRELIGSRLSPAVKVPIELMANKNLYYNKPIVDESLPSSMQKAKAPDVVTKLPDMIKQLLGYQESTKVDKNTGKEKTTKEMDAKLAYLLGQLGPFSKYGNLPSGIDKENVAAGGSGGIQSLISAFNSTASPFKANIIDPQQQAESNQKQREQELQSRINYLIQKGIIPKLR